MHGRQMSHFADLTPDRAAPPRRGGRPRLRDDARRNERLRVRVSKEERAQIENLAEAAALPLGTYLRWAALNRKIRPAVPAVNYLLLREHHRLGESLHQALLAVYARGASLELRAILLELLTLLQELRSALVGRDAGTGRAER